jgi:hypothetical protein
VRLDFRVNPVVGKWPRRPHAAAHVVRIAMRKDDDISGLQLDGMSIRHLDDRAAVDDEMVKHQVRHSHAERGRLDIRRWHRKAPWS